MTLQVLSMHIQMKAHNSLNYNVFFPKSYRRAMLLFNCWISEDISIMLHYSTAFIYLNTQLDVSYLFFFENNKQQRKLIILLVNYSTKLILRIVGIIRNKLIFTKIRFNMMNIGNSRVLRDS